ncbi:50S ribosomal protein L19e [archaeon]|jgi:large subunit ribosomal protein L19e|nr:50S ribosomal protein L19e [archaeon]MBT3450710.1 50S ribosomal protein L19e [archaeon]MBT6869202.1 50S ribosomal protein L19e [archaeon]MBT7193738.1 50S ribosomal protein L19e [archaeon]MBT7381385.1 50S ribosomal protein L19e [archaeon]
MINKKRLAAKILKVSPSKITFASDALEDIKKGITRADIRGLIAVKKIFKKGTNEQSRGRARKKKIQKSKGRQSGRGSKKGSKHSTLSKKAAWILKIRTQRKFIKELKERSLIDSTIYRQLYRKSKGGYFRNKRHIKLYLNEQNMINKK